MKGRTAIVLLLASLWAGAQSEGPQPQDIVDHYCAVTRAQLQLMQGSSMDVEIVASLPKLKKHGKLVGRRRVSAEGRITYEKLHFEGDGTVKKQIIIRYLNAEAEAQQNRSHSLELTPENYKFKFKAKALLDGRDTYVFDVSPKHKRQGLFQGQLWIDAATYLRVQDAGYLVKSPSIMLKKVVFLRKYDIRGGMSVPRQEQTTVDTRLGVGPAEMTIDFTNFSLDSDPNGAPEML